MLTAPDPRKPPADWLPFLRRIEENPQDVGPVGAWGDYLEERGHPWGEPLLWAFRMGKVPYLTSERDEWWWWRDGERRRYGQTQYELPPALDDCLGGDWCSTSPTAAWFGLCKAWCRMADADRAALLAAPVPTLLF